MGLRDMWRVFRESRGAVRERATLAVAGDGRHTAELASILGAQRDLHGAEIVLTVPERDGALELSVEISGEAVEEPGEVPLSATDERTLHRELAPQVARALDEDYLVALGRGYPFFRRAACERITRNNARQNALIGALPIPGADMPVMSANQGRMVLAIAAAHGEELSLERARELIGVLGAGLGLRAAARQVVKFTPFGGWAAAAAIGYAGTAAMGRAAMLYFERGGQRVGERELAGIRERAVKEARNFVSRMRRR